MVNREKYLKKKNDYKVDIYLPPLYSSKYHYTILIVLMSK